MRPGDPPLVPLFDELRRERLRELRLKGQPGAYSEARAYASQWFADLIERAQEERTENEARMREEAP